VTITHEIKLGHLKGADARVRLALVRTLDRVALEAQREMSRRAPKAFSQLARSITIERPSELERRIAPSVNYGLYVEQGTGPAAGRPRYWPNVHNLAEWVKLRFRVQFRNTRKGSAARQSQLEEWRDATYRLARVIYLRGTRAQPFVAPTAATVRASAPSRVLAALESAMLNRGNA
jgi:hypothetical protein